MTPNNKFRNQRRMMSSKQTGVSDEGEQEAVEEHELLGTAQLETQCRGEFCNFDLRIYTSPASDLNDVCDPTIERFVARQASSTGTARLIEQETAETFQARKGVDRLIDHEAFARNIPPTRNDLFYELPLLVLVQARKEKYLVDNFLQRYNQGQPNAEFLMNLQEKKHLFQSKNFPGHYYAPVKLCQTCYLIYNMIQKARASSLAKISVTELERRAIETKSVKNDFLLVDDEGSAALEESKPVMGNLETLKDTGSVLARSLLAITCISKSDIYEVRSFSKPPDAVLMTVSALFVLLCGKGYSWNTARRALSHVDHIFQEMSCLIPHHLRRSQWKELGRYINNPAFRPEKIFPISKAAAKISAWVLGMANGFNWKNEWFAHHAKLDPLINFPAFAVEARLKLMYVDDQEKMWNEEMDSRLKLAAQKRKDISCCIDNADTLTTVNNNVKRFVKNKGKASVAQHQSMERLSRKKNIRMERKPLSISRLFTCCDGMTRIPYEVLSGPDLVDTTTCFIVCHDIFDTLEATKLIFYSLVKEYSTCKVLLYNYPGQVGTEITRLIENAIDNTSKQKKEPVLNNCFLAGILNELLLHVSTEKEFTFTNCDCYLVGFGVGVPVALSFAHLFGESPNYRDSLKAIVSINGFAHVDAHLASILHSSINLFRSLPDSRPDLPVSFFTKFLFSDHYVEKVTMNLALSIFTAVINPITLDGRIRLCNGVLKNLDLREEVQRLDFPIIALRSTSNCFVLPSNTDTLLKGRTVSRICSSDIVTNTGKNESCYSKSSLCLVSDTLSTKRGGLDVSLCAGHAISQECKRALTDLFFTFAGIVGCKKLDSIPQVLDPEKETSDVIKFVGPCEVEQLTQKCNPEKNCNFFSEKAQNFNAAEEEESVNKCFISEATSAVEIGTHDLPERVHERICDDFIEYSDSFPVTDCNKGTYNDRIIDANKKEQDTDRLFRLTSMECELLRPVINSHQTLDISNENNTSESLLNSYTPTDKRADIKGVEISDLTVVRPSVSSQQSKKEPNQRRGKLAESIRSYLETGLPWDLSPSMNMKTMISQLNGLSSFVNTDAVISTAYTPPTYDDLLLQAARELEDEQARERIIYKNAKQNLARRNLEKKQAMINKQYTALSGDTCGSNFHWGISNQPVHSDTETRDFLDDKSESMFEIKGRQIQKLFRGHDARCKCEVLKKDRKSITQMIRLSVILQCCVRRKIIKRKFNFLRKQEKLRFTERQIALNMQYIWRKGKGHAFRKQIEAADTIQSWILTALHRKNEVKKRRCDAIRRWRLCSAVKIEGQWRKRIASKLLGNLKFVLAAAITIQRILRGFFDRKAALYLRKWESIEPGLERINLSSILIDEARKEFDRQQCELTQMKISKEKAMYEFSNIVEALRQSEQEVAALQNEISNLTKVQGDKKKTNVGVRTYQNRSQHLEEQLSIISADVEKKRKSLEELERAITKIDDERGQRERDLRLVEKKLSKFLNEQQIELDQLRKMGIELETAAATSAAASEATAKKAQEHEKQALDMFRRQEEMLKFQFMTMSMSYLSTVKILKDMRDMTTDITSSALTSSATTASAAALAAAAANIMPNRNKGFLVADLKDQVIRSSSPKGKAIDVGLTSKENIVDDQDSLPSDCRRWTISHVSSWLRGLSLGKYVRSFEEACVDGELLLDLTDDDLLYALGMEHKLHRRKIMLAQDKLKLLNSESKNVESSSGEDQALLETGSTIGNKEEVVPVPDARTVFSHLRHRRLALLEKSLDSGFDINTKDDHGNTLLIVAVQNSNASMLEFLLRRGSRINDANSNGNTALHFALAYDTTGQLGEFLIENGADDTIENNLGLTPYDGLGLEENKMIANRAADDEVADASFDVSPSKP